MSPLCALPRMSYSNATCSPTRTNRLTNLQRPHQRTQQPTSLSTLLLPQIAVIHPATTTHQHPHPHPQERQRPLRSRTRPRHRPTCQKPQLRIPVRVGGNETSYLVHLVLFPRHRPHSTQHTGSSQKSRFAVDHRQRLRHISAHLVIDPQDQDPGSPCVSDLVEGERGNEAGR